MLAVVLLLYYDPFLIPWWPQKPAEKTKTDSLPLDMATDSIDDMYDGCRSEAASVIDLFGVFDWHYNRNFSLAWASVEKDAKKPAHKHLKEDHAVAMYMYTKVKKIRQLFNEAVKAGKHIYSTYSFKFNYLYFYLTDAIHILRQNQTSCRITYHRSLENFNHNVINTNMRFGTFIWATSSKQSFDFNGNVSCFEIYTCFGAEITYYSAENQKGQVLIPPYEVFKITDVLTNDQWCNVVYKLQSTKTPRRDLNCKLNEKQMETYFGAVLTRWHVSRVVTMSACIILWIISSLILIKKRQKHFVATVLGTLLVLVIIMVIWRIIQ
ncbi:ecto-ADP-ribosyltransferase 4-like [Thunnus albacares]|uniref:ecto-ADP-ribosyltransferase 4-like n=1 Tax=Thunnus albacares TaxID=8236 RepID=UPI001CF61949|nr:ecto-ADP-ribosyltransferase 4-like [Thunnus albacares]